MNDEVIRELRVRIDFLERRQRRLEIGPRPFRPGSTVIMCGLSKRSLAHSGALLR